MKDIYEVLASPSRREILRLVSQQERCVSELAEQLQLSQPAVSKHLKALSAVGLVQVRQEKQLRWYRLSPAPLRQVDAWLEQFRHYWLNRLDALEEHLEKER
ncbi:MAG: ArsR/SmtB family transcription factor [Bacillota bacterium]|jgi:DNA-binding transcriptional ArsR family regulator